MNRQLLLGLLVLISFFIGSFSVKAAVVPVKGCVDPQISTAEAPVWYTMMSSHMSDVNRQNRFLLWDGLKLRTEKFDEGVPVSQLDDRYLWRLEKGSADNKVYIVNRAGMRVFAEAGISPNTGANTLLTVTETGVEWVMALSSSTGQPDCADKQYCFNYLGASAQPAYLNAMDSQNGDTQKAYGVTVYEMGVHQASGWFFYKAELAAYNVTYEGTVVGGSFVVKNGDAIVESGSSVDEGTWLTIEATPEENYLVKAIKVNGVTIDGQGFNLSEASEITVEFTNKLVYRYSPVEGGTVSASIGEMPLDNEGEFDRGSDVVLTVLANEHYELSSLLVNGDEKKESLESGKLTLSNVQENITVSAVFTKKKYSVTFTSTGDGQLVLKNGSSSLSSGALVEYGTELTGSLVYSDPTRLSKLTNNGESILETVVNKTFTITVEGSVELVAEFKGATYTVTYPTELTGGKLKVTQDSDGEEIPSGTELQKNTAITIVPEAELGYEIGSFMVNGVDRLTELSENGGEYWITIAEDVELTVTFTPLTGISGAKLTEVYFDRTTSILHAPEGAMWRVYNITGSAVFEGQGTQNLQNLSVGTYIAKVKTDNGIRTIKFIKK